ncbi:MAG: hypothetical protein ABIK07_08985 [Planctomycetota bacterium]
MGKVKRSQVKTFLNTGTPAAPVWVLVGDGVVNAKINYNPKTLEETYISEDSANISVESYSPSIPIEMTALNSDLAFEYIDAIRIARSVLGDVETEICNVWLYETPGLGYYPAEKQSISIQIDDFGGDGGTAVKTNYTLNFIDDPIPGTFNPTPTAAFVATPVNTILTTLVLGSGTLSPLFATDKSWLWYTTTIAAASVTMASTLAGATIVQKVGAVVVAQGDPAALSMGANTLTITVTVGAEVSVYTIIATRTA